MPSWKDFCNTLLAFALTAGAAGVLVAPLAFIFGVRHLLPLQRLRRGGWSGAEVLASFGLIFLIIPSLTKGFFEHLDFFGNLFDKPPSPIRVALWTAPLETPLALAILLLVLFLTSRTRPSHLGLSTVRWPRNVILGHFSFLVFTPVVLALHFVILLCLQALGASRPEAHPLETLTKEALLPTEWVLLFFRAAVSAPLLEELFFRGIFQGWLRRASFLGHVTVIVIGLGLGLLNFLIGFEADGKPSDDVSSGPLIFSVVLALVYGVALYRVWAPVIWHGDKFLRHGPAEVPPEPAGELPLGQAAENGAHEEPVSIAQPSFPGQGDPASERWRNWQIKNARLAILGSAMIFALSHGAWPSPIPLFLLGGGLGYLAFRTQSIISTIVVHSLFNTVACVELILPHLLG